MSDNHAGDVQRFIDGVLDGSIVTGRLQRLAVHRHCDDLMFAGERGFYFDPDVADAAIRFSSFCRQFDGEWLDLPLSLRLEQKFIVWCLLGWRNKDDDCRRFRHAQLEFARKWGKSTIAAYLVNLCLYADEPFEPGAQAACVATKQKQTFAVWEMAAQMIEHSPELKGEARILRGRHEILFPASASKFEALACEENSGDSFNMHILIKDEEHAYREQHRRMMRALKSGGGAKRQPLSITITTYGDDKSVIWQESHDYAVKVLESVISGNIIDDTWFAFIAALDYPHEAPCFRCLGDRCMWCAGTGTIKPDDPFDERCWPKANPGLPITPKIKEMRALANEAKNGIGKLEFFQKNLNIVVASKERIILPEVWEACHCELSDWSTADRIHGGFDLGATDDLAAVSECAQFDMVDDDGVPFQRYELSSQSFIAEERPEHMQIEFLSRWVHEGRLHQSSGPAVDYNAVEEHIVERSELLTINTWAHDKNEARQMGQTLVNKHGLPTFKFTQAACHYSEPIKLFISLLQQTRIVGGVKMRLIRHGGCPVLAWQASNLIIRYDHRGHGMPDKSQPMNKIDAMVAILMAFSECLYAQKEEVNSNYKYGDLRG